MNTSNYAVSVKHSPDPESLSETSEYETADEADVSFHEIVAELLDELVDTAKLEAGKVTVSFKGTPCSEARLSLTGTNHDARICVWKQA